MNDPLISALADLWNAIRAHREVPDVAIMLGNAEHRRSEPAWGHHTYPRTACHTDPEFELIVDPHWATRVGAERVLVMMLHEAAHGLSHSRGVVDLKQRDRWSQRHNRRFAAHSWEMGLTGNWDLDEGWRITGLRADTVQKYREPVRALADAIDELQHRTTNPLADQPAACGCAPPRHLLARTLGFAIAAPHCPDCDQTYQPAPTPAATERDLFTALYPGATQQVIAPKAFAALGDVWDAVQTHHTELPDVRVVLGETRAADSRSPWGHRTVSRPGPSGEEETQLEIGLLELQDAPVEHLMLTLVHEAAHGLAHARGLTDRGSALDPFWDLEAWHNKRFRRIAAEIGLECRWEGRSTGAGWVPGGLTAAAAERYGPPSTALQHALEEERRTVFPLALAADCVCWGTRRVRIDSRTLADAAPHCPVCDRSYHPSYSIEPLTARELACD